METQYEIKLSGKNPNASENYAIISINKLPFIIDYKWYLNKNGYPFTYMNGARVMLHRYIWSIDNKKIIDKNIYIDHINRNKLDARDENLRESTPAENSYNKTSTSKILDPMTNDPLHHIKLTKTGYTVTITKNKIINRIDKISSLEEAKEIYNIMAIEMFGQFAVLY